MPADPRFRPRPHGPRLALAFLLAWPLAAAWPATARADAVGAGVQAQVHAAALAWARSRAADAGLSAARMQVVVLPAVRQMPPCVQPLSLQVADVPAGERFDRLQVSALCPADGGQGRFVARVSMPADVVVARTAAPESALLSSTPSRSLLYNVNWSNLSMLSCTVGGCFGGS